MARLSPLTDEQIAALISERKAIPHSYRAWLRPRKVGQHRNLQASHRITCENGHAFGIYARHRTDRDNDFSLGLRLLSSSGKDIGLIRCNGWQARHRNVLEAGTPNEFIPPNTCHIHRASARYLAIDSTLEAIGMATPTGDYLDLETAIEYFVQNFGFVSDKTGEPFHSATPQPLLPGASS